MISYDSTTTISGPADEIFALIVEPDRIGEWTSMSGGRWLTQAPHGAGSRAEATLHIGPFRRPFRWEVTDYQPNRRYEIRTLPGGPLDWNGVYELEPAGVGTIVTSRGDVKPNGLLRLLEPLLRSELPKDEANELEQLKTIIEREGRTDAG
jgi:carbon monoxide dehydrogenase subunit G